MTTVRDTEARAAAAQERRARRAGPAEGGAGEASPGRPVSPRGPEDSPARGGSRGRRAVRPTERRARRELFRQRLVQRFPWLEPLLAREVAGMPVRVPALALVTATLLVPVGFSLAAIGIGVLQLSGGAATDTSLVVMVAAFLVTDFWGGSLVHAATSRSARDVMFVWVAARAVLLVLLVVVVGRIAPVALVELALAAPAAWLGARVGAKQASLRASA